MSTAKGATGLQQTSVLVMVVVVLGVRDVERRRGAEDRGRGVGGRKGESLRLCVLRR